MPWQYPNNVPRVAKNWSNDEKRRCTAAANAVLNKGGSEQDAIFACIHAAGRSRKKQEGSEYDKLVEEGAKKLQQYVLSFMDGLITLSQLRQLMFDEMRIQYTQLVLLGIDEGRGREFDDFDLDWLDGYLSRQEEYLDGFMRDLETDTSSRDRYLWRAGLYAAARPAYVHGTVPQEISLLMPVLPGDDCLGGSNCHCWLDVEEDDRNYYVYWMLDPASESCPVCVAHSIESPFVFEKAEMILED